MTDLVIYSVSAVLMLLGVTAILGEALDMLKEWLNGLGK